MIKIYYYRFLLLMPLLFVAHSSASWGSQPVPIQSNQTTYVAPGTAGVRLESDGALYWLHFDADADSLWPALKNFWANEGIILKHEQPQLGFMETEWIQDLQQNTFSSILFSNQAPKFKERFRLRVERLPNKTGTRVFINQSSYGILFDEEAVYTGYLPPSPEQEVQMLLRLALFSGADKKQLIKVASAYKAFQIEAKPAGKNRFEIIVPGAVEFVRNKLIQALDRMDIQVKIQADGAIRATSNTTSKLDNTSAKRSQANWEIDDDSDLEGPRLIDYQNPAKSELPTNLVYILGLMADKSSVIIRLISHPNNADNDGFEITRFSEAVARNLSR